MKKLRLCADDLLVHSFETSPLAAEARALAEIQAPESIVAPTTDPTAMTWCRICPTY